MRLLLMGVLALSLLSCGGDCLDRTSLYRCTCTPAVSGSALNCATSADQAAGIAEANGCNSNGCQCTCTFEAFDCDPNHNSRCPR